MPELSHAAGQIISYLEMCQAWSASLQKGMNFHLRPDRSVVLMSRRSNAPYRDQIEEGGRVLIYEGHDVAQTARSPDPKTVDQPRLTPTGKLTQNGLFERAALNAKSGKIAPEVVAVYEKIHAGIWAFNGMFRLTNAWQEQQPQRKVFKFRLELVESELNLELASAVPVEQTRIIPSVVKLEVWKRDCGKCVLCGAADNLHYDHDLPYSKGGSSLTAENIRLLCARHNLAKSNKIE
jgi:hypothetical protein